MEDGDIPAGWGRRHMQWRLLHTGTAVKGAGKGSNRSVNELFKIFLKNPLYYIQDSQNRAFPQRDFRALNTSPPISY